MEQPDSIHCLPLTAVDMDEIYLDGALDQPERGKLNLSRTRLQEINDLSENSTGLDKPNVYIDLDGKWKLELNGESFEEETTDEPSTAGPTESVDKESDGLNSKFCQPVFLENHKFSDGIVWETIEECDEENFSRDVHKY